VALIGDAAFIPRPHTAVGRQRSKRDRLGRVTGQAQPQRHQSAEKLGTVNLLR